MKSKTSFPGNPVFLLCWRWWEAIKCLSRRIARRLGLIERAHGVGWGREMVRVQVRQAEDEQERTFPEGGSHDHTERRPGSHGPGGD